MVTALDFTGIVCFTPRAGLGTAVTALGTHPRGSVPAYTS